MRDLIRLLKTHPGQNLESEPTKFADLRTIFRWLRPKPGDCVFDLGAGFGRVVLYGALVSSARYHAVELTQERCDQIITTVGRLEINSVSVTKADFLDVDLSDASVIYLNNPCYPNKSEEVLSRLQRVDTKCKIVALNGIVRDIRASVRFRELDVDVMSPFKFGAFTLIG